MSWLAQFWSMKRSHDLPSALQRAQESQCCSPTPNQEVWDPVTDGLSSGMSLKAQELRELCLRAGEDSYLSSSKESKFTFLQPFCSVWALSGLDAALPPVLLLNLPIQMGALSQKYPKIMLYQLSDHTLAQSNWHMKLTITLIKHSDFLQFYFLVWDGKQGPNGLISLKAIFKSSWVFCWLSHRPATF